MSASVGFAVTSPMPYRASAPSVSGTSLIVVTALTSSWRAASPRIDGDRVQRAIRSSNNATVAVPATAMAPSPRPETRPVSPSTGCHVTATSSHRKPCISGTDYDAAGKRKDTCSVR
jgi:hypothetical protein